MIRTDLNAPQDYIVTLDGVKQTHCIIADDVQGFIRRYKKTKMGTLVGGRTGLITEDLKGVVVISKKPGL